MTDLGRLLGGLGLLLLLAGGVILLAARLGFPLGHLPGDLHWRSRHTTIFAPLGTCLLVSLLLSLGWALLRHLRR